MSATSSANSLFSLAMRVGLVVIPSKTPMSTNVLIDGILAVSRKIFNQESPRRDQLLSSSNNILRGKTILHHQFLVFSRLSESVSYADHRYRNWVRARNNLSNSTPQSTNDILFLSRYNSPSLLCRTNDGVHVKRL